MSLSIEFRYLAAIALTSVSMAAFVAVFWSVRRVWLRKTTMKFLVGAVTVIVLFVLVASTPGILSAMMSVTAPPAAVPPAYIHPTPVDLAVPMLSALIMWLVLSATVGRRDAAPN